MTTVSPSHGYELWSARYDDNPNPVIALEQRILQAKMRIRSGMTVVDLGTGTGRWLTHAVSCGAFGIGLDLSTDMLAVAAKKENARGRLAVADICRIPLGDGSVDLAICSLTLGYIHDVETAFREMARVARRVIVSELHPDAIEAGWSRSFRIGQRTYDIAHYLHSTWIINECAKKAGLIPEWTIEACFDEPERTIFEHAGRVREFVASQHVKAVLISAWVLSSEARS